MKVKTSYEHWIAKYIQPKFHQQQNVQNHMMRISLLCKNQKQQKSQKLLFFSFMKMSRTWALWKMWKALSRQENFSFTRVIARFSTPSVQSVGSVKRVNTQKDEPFGITFLLRNCLVWRILNGNEKIHFFKVIINEHINRLELVKWCYLSLLR